MNDQKKHNSLSIIIPAKNESAGLSTILPRLRQLLPHAEIIVVNDASVDDTPRICQPHNVKLITRPYSMGNGAAIKTGARVAAGDILTFMDADGQHSPDDLPRLLSKLDEGYDMVVGARDSGSQSSIGRSYANRIYNRLASWMVGTRIDDLTSGFRTVRADKFRKFLYLLPNGFSYPTTITMSFFRAGHPVAYVPIVANRRKGKSHIRIMHDGVRFLLIIFKIGTLYAPLKLFFPVSLGFFCTGLIYYLYTFFLFQRFTNMSALLFISSILVFLIGLVSEQITALNYKDSEK
jgi:glycosyltransferase involved in cell wall biosynthesis